LSIAEDVSAVEMLSALSFVTLLFGAGVTVVLFLGVTTVAFVPLGGTVLRLHANNKKQAVINKKYFILQT
jgi:hypothetical protein